jgi:hypothetical protein
MLATLVLDIIFPEFHVRLDAGLKRTRTFPVRNMPTDVDPRNETSTFLNAESELFTVTPRANQTLQSQQFPTRAGGSAVCLGQGRMCHVLPHRGNPVPFEQRMW